MNSKRIVVVMSLAACASACAGRSTPPERPRRVDNVEQVTASIQDSAMRERWRQAAAAGQLPSLSTLPVPDTMVSTRQRVRVADVPLERGAAVIPPQVVADVRLLGLDTLRVYQGPITLAEPAADRVRGTLVNAPAVEIHFKLPANQPLLLLAGPHALLYRDDVVNNSLRRELLITAPNAPVLLHLNDGSNTPYDRTFRELPLRVRQTGPAEQERSPVEIIYADQRLTLMPGERRRVRDTAGEAEFFVLSSHYTAPAQVATAEGDPYHVVVMMYRVR